MNLLDLLEQANIYIQIGAIAIGVIYVAIVYFALKVYLNDVVRRRKERKEKFHQTLLIGLKTGTIESLDDILNIYKGINQSNSIDSFSINLLLRDFIVKLQLKDLGSEYSEEEVKQWKNLLTIFIKKNEEMSPFAELPNSERNIMNDILAYLDKNDQESIKRKLHELAAIIQTRKEHLDKTEKANKLSIPLAVFGLILTIVFGVASLI